MLSSILSVIRELCKDKDKNRRLNERLSARAKARSAATSSTFVLFPSARARTNALIANMSKNTRKRMAAIPHMNATWLWIETETGKFSASMGFGAPQNVGQFFRSIEEKFSEKHGSDFDLGRLQMIGMAFSYLGPEFAKPRILTLKESNSSFKEFCWDLFKAFEGSREIEEPADLVIVDVTARFERDA